MSGVRFQRANFVVSDLDESLKFYRDVLGFGVAYLLEKEEDTYSHPVFEIPPGTKTRFATLHTETQVRVMALTEIQMPLEPVPHPRRSAIVVETPDVDGVVAGARALGLQVYPEEHLVTPDGREGREVGIVDNDDNLVVIYYIPES